MPLVYIVVDDAKKGIYHSETELTKYPYVKVCLEEKTWNFISQRCGQSEITLFNDPKPLGSFCEWTSRLPCGLVVGVFDSESVEHVTNYALFMDKVIAWRERKGVERRHTSQEIYPF